MLRHIDIWKKKGVRRKNFMKRKSARSRRDTAEEVAKREGKRNKEVKKAAKRVLKSGKENSNPSQKRSTCTSDCGVRSSARKRGIKKVELQRTISSDECDVIRT